MAIIKETYGYEVQINLADIPANQQFADKEILDYIGARILEGNYSGFITLEIGKNKERKEIHWERTNEEDGV